MVIDPSWRLALNRKLPEADCTDFTLQRISAKSAFSAGLYPMTPVSLMPLTYWMDGGQTGSNPKLEAVPDLS